MSFDAKKHTTLAAGEAPSRAGIAAGLLSVNDIVPVASATEQAQIATALSGTDFPVGASRPLVTARANARGLHMVELSTDGSVFVPVSGVLSFTTKTAANSWATANAALLTVGDRCVAAGLDYRWSGSAWKGVLPYGEKWSGVTSSVGIVTVNHPLAAEPASIVVTDYNSGGAPNTRKVIVSGVTATQIQFYVTNGGNALVSNPVEFYWLAYPS